MSIQNVNDVAVGRSNQDKDDRQEKLENQADNSKTDQYPREGTSQNPRSSLYQSRNYMNGPPKTNGSFRPRNKDVLPYGERMDIPDLNIKPDCKPLKLATEILLKLKERNYSVFYRVVDTLEKEKVIKYFKETQEIEKNGGMLTLNGSRRRTSGGLFLYLIKNAEDVSKTQKEEIFGENYDGVTFTNKHEPVLRPS